MIKGILFGGFLLLSLTTIATAAERIPADTAGAERAFGNLPVYFIENQGQIDSEEVAYYVKGADKTLYFTSEGITFALTRDSGDEMERWTVKLSFLGANETKPVGVDKQQAVFSYFKGEPEDWKTGLPTYGKLVYENLWPGIDLVYSGTANQLKYEFVVAPGADPDTIRLEYAGAEDVAITEGGALRVTTPVGGFVDDVPLAYQIVEGEEKEVSMHYALSERAVDDAYCFGFDIGNYDPSEPLFLDPTMLVYCGYIGGTKDESGRGIAVDDQGNAYVTGETKSYSSTFPVKVGPDLGFNGGYGDIDAFVAKVSFGDVVADIKIDGQDGPLTVPATQSIEMTVSLDPGSQEGIAHDWWIGGMLDKTDLYCWTYLGGWTFCSSGHPMRAYDGPLVDLTDFTICQGRLPVGSWTFVFVLDYENRLYEGSYFDSIEITSY